MTPSLSQFIQKRTAEYGAPVPMTHVIYGYPSIKASLDWMRALLDQGVDILEVQFPFSDPVADGPTIVQACHQALESQPSIAQFLSDIKEVSVCYPNSKILFMSYLNPVYRFGIERFVQAASQAGISGCILPDLPLEQAQDYQRACQQYKVEPIWLTTPVTPKERLKDIVEHASGMLYCVSRSGVTGQKSLGAEDNLKSYLAKVRSYMTTQNPVPLAVGFGIRNPEQVQALTDEAEVAIVGSALLDAYKEGGIEKGIALVKALFPYVS